MARATGVDVECARMIARATITDPKPTRTPAAPNGLAEPLLRLKYQPLILTRSTPEPARPNNTAMKYARIRTFCMTRGDATRNRAVVPYEIQSPRSIFSNRVDSRRNAIWIVSVGPLRCLAISSLALP